MSGRPPPKGYSITRGPASDAKVQCQSCGSSAHWTYECNSKAAATKQAAGGAKLSRTQMLRLGITKPLQVVAPPKTEREIFNEQLREAELLLVASEADTDAITQPKKRQREEPAPSDNESSVAPKGTDESINPLDKL